MTNATNTTPRGFTITLQGCEDTVEELVAANIEDRLDIPTPGYSLAEDLGCAWNNIADTLAESGYAWGSAEYDAALALFVAAEKRILGDK